MASHKLVLIIIITLAIVFLNSCSADLSPDHYNKTCPGLLGIVEKIVNDTIQKEARMAASLLRLHFHDCFVRGCDASILLNGKNSEKGALPNSNSARGFNIIDKIKSAVEAACPGRVSCADILAIAARDSVAALGGPDWTVDLGRLDSTVAYLRDANSSAIPGPTLSFASLISVFKAHGLSLRDLIALSGGHTIGQARCITFKARIWNGTNIDPAFAKQRQSNCSNSTSSINDNKLAPLDSTPTKFDNSYYSDVMANKGLLQSDHQLFRVGNVTADGLVRLYSTNQTAFFDAFRNSMIRMAKIGVLTGSRGEIRRNCRKVNKK